MKKVLRAVCSPIPLLLLLLIGSVPFWPSLHFVPLTSEMPAWIASSASSNPDWQTWVFQSPHFSWYRPLTALSYTVTHAMSGLEPLGYRAFDLILHLMAATLCMGLLRWLAPSLRKRVLMLAVLLFLAHAATDEVVPFMGRRSFSIAAFFGLAGLSILTREVRCVPVERAPAALFFPAVVVGLVFCAGLLSNEGAICFVAVAPLLAWSVASDRKLPARSWILPGLIPAALVAGVLAWRYRVLGGLGGASAAAPTDLLADPQSSSSLMDSVSWLFGAPSLERGLGGAGTVLGYVAVAAGVVLVLRALLVPIGGPFGRWGDARERMRFGLALWIVATLGLFLVSDTWAARHTYFALAPLALLVALSLGRTGAPDASSDETPLPALAKLQGVAAAIVAAALLVGSPILHGQDSARCWPERNAVTRNAIGGLNGIERPVVVHVAIPDFTQGGLFAGPGAKGAPVPPAARQPVTWANLVLTERGIELVDLVYYRLDGGASAFDLERPDRKAAFVAAPGQDYLLRTGRGVDYVDADGERRVELLPVPVSPERGVYSLLVTTEDAKLQLVRVPIRDETSLGAEYFPPDVIQSLGESDGG